MIIQGLSNIESLFRGDKEIVFVFLGDKMVYQKRKSLSTLRFNSFSSYNTMSKYNSSSVDFNSKNHSVYNLIKFNSGLNYNNKE